MLCDGRMQSAPQGIESSCKLPDTDLKILVFGKFAICYFFVLSAQLGTGSLRSTVMFLAI